MPHLDDSLKKIVGAKNVYSDCLRRFAYGTDASFYRMVPSIVALPDNEMQMQKLLGFCSGNGKPVTFHAAGTSLSGQASTDAILVCAAQKWEKYNIRDNGRLIDVQPGLRGGRINSLLAPYKRKLGPDPASVNAAMIGGIVANNASGMNGTLENSYRTIRAARIVFADGSLLDTCDEQSRNAFAASHAAMINGLKDIRRRIHNDKPTYDKLKHKYSIKNTTGLNMAPFVDYEDVFDILLHLMVGSEGTLGFLSQITLETLEVFPHKASALLFFNDIVTACRTIQRIAATPAHSVELLDRRALRSVENQKGIPDYIRDFDDKATAVLIETKAHSKEELAQNIAQIKQALHKEDMVRETEFTDIPSEYALYWKVRAGVFPSVGGTRPEGSNCLIEDVAFPLASLPEATADLQNLLQEAGYHDAVIYGHAKEGNYHFIINPDFEKSEELQRYQLLMERVAALVVDKYDGSLKAEHGTGRNMAPFVRKEWGDTIYGLMKEVKALLDPHGILNPGVIFNDDPLCFIKNLKSLTPVHEDVNRCIECGFCEPNCLTASLTLSSRQRIAIQREIARLKQRPRTDAEETELRELQKSYIYEGEQTCAKDGLCSLTCPVSINTGNLTRFIRQTNVTPNKKRVSKYLADHFKGAFAALRGILRLARFGQCAIGTKGMLAATAAMRTLSGKAIPRWSPAMPKGISAPKPPKQKTSADKVVYLPSCMNRVMGASAADTDKRPLWQVMATLLERSGYETVFPENYERLCCGMSWDSKGLKDEAAQKAAELEQALLKASENGRYPILCDQSPCLFHMRETIKSIERIYEPVEFIDRFLLNRLSIKRTDEAIAVHFTCSIHKLGLNDAFLRVAKACSANVFVPEGIKCCGFAGDRGFTYPEVNKFALRELRAQIESKGIRNGYSDSRTCEIGLAEHSGVPYQSIAYLVERCSR